MRSLETSLGDSFTSQHLWLLHCLYHTMVAHSRQSCADCLPGIESTECLITRWQDRFQENLKLDIRKWNTRSWNLQAGTKKARALNSYVLTQSLRSCLVSENLLCSESPTKISFFLLLTNCVIMAGKLWHLETSSLEAAATTSEARNKLYQAKRAVVLVRPCVKYVFLQTKHLHDHALVLAKWTKNHTKRIWKK